MKSRLIVIACFFIAFGAGLSAGVLWQKKQTTPDDRWLSELNLSAEQREKIKAIWAEAMNSGGWQAQREKREALQKERDEALKAILDESQKQRYSDITQKYQKEIDAISEAAKRAKDDAYERTKALLDDNQKVTYDQLRQKRAENRSRGRADGLNDKPAIEPAAPGMTKESGR